MQVSLRLPTSERQAYTQQDMLYFTSQIPIIRFEISITKRFINWVTSPIHRGGRQTAAPRTIIGLYEEQKKIPVIIMDEGHLLKRDMLEEIQCLTNFRMDSFSPMSLLLLVRVSLNVVCQGLQKVSLPEWRWRLMGSLFTATPM